MINNVRNTVMFILNKENNGYLTPEEFNSFARQAQLDVLEDVFYSYNKWLNKRLTKQAFSGAADVVKQTAEVIDRFTVTTPLTYAAGVFQLPSDMYLAIDVINSGKVVERVEQSKATYFLNSSFNAPTVYYPAYTMSDSTITVYPSTITSNVSALYVRYPLDPKWTFITDPTSGASLFNQSASDYQDFELPYNYSNDLIVRILKYAGINIREADVVAFANNEEVTNMTQEQ
jgi:hypothetical protein